MLWIVDEFHEPLGHRLVSEPFMRWRLVGRICAICGTVREPISARLHMKASWEQGSTASWVLRACSRGLGRSAG